MKYKTGDKVWAATGDDIVKQYQIVDRYNDPVCILSDGRYRFSMPEYALFLTKKECIEWNIARCLRIQEDLDLAINRGQNSIIKLRSQLGDDGG